MCAFPWGNAEPDDDINALCNIWQGQFPHTNTRKDGYEATAPSVSFEPNGYGLFNMVGNVWEWTADPFRKPSNRILSRVQTREPSEMIKLAKGGSFLCHKSYCYRYRIAARIGNSIDSATTHMGFSGGMGLFKMLTHSKIVKKPVHSFNWTSHLYRHTLQMRSYPQDLCFSV